MTRVRVGCVVFGALVVVAGATVPSGASTPAGGPAPVWIAPVTLVPNSSFFDVSSYEVAAAADSSDRSVVFVAGGTGLEAFVRPAQSPTFSASTTVTSEGAFYPNVEGARPSVATLPDGTVVAAWSVGNFTGIAAATLAPGASSWTTRMIATGTDLYDVQVTGGSGGAAGTVWTDGNTVWSSTLPAGADQWSAPSTASDPVPGNAYPLIENPLVAVTGDGTVVASWDAYDGVDTNGIYRSRAAALSPGDSAWSAPQWVSPGDALESKLVAATDGSVTEIWLDGTGHLAVSSLAAGSWSDARPVPTPATGNTPDLGAGPNGVLTAVWSQNGYDGGPATIASADYTAAGGWSTPSTVDIPGTSLGYEPRALVAADGAVTVLWSVCDQSSCATDTASRTASGWSVPDQVADDGPSLGGLDAAISPSGLLTVIYNRSLDDQLQRTMGVYSVDAIAEYRPTPLTVRVPPRVVVRAAVGQTLTAGTGRWSARPGSYSYRWLRNGAAIRGAIRPRYRTVLADAGTRLSVTVTAHRVGYADAAATSPAVPIARPLLRSLAAPTITGVARVRHVLTVHSGRWSARPTTLRYQWLRSGRPIRHANHPRYRLTRADRRHPIAARVTAIQVPYRSGTRTTRAIRIR